MLFLTENKSNCEKSFQKRKSFSYTEERIYSEEKSKNVWTFRGGRINFTEKTNCNSDKNVRISIQLIAFDVYTFLV